MAHDELRCGIFSYSSSRQPSWLDYRMKKQTEQDRQHNFSKLPAFDEAMRKLIQVPKEDVEKREAAERTPRTKES